MGAGFREDIEAIRMLIRAGADVNDPSVDESPLLGAVKWSHFKAATQLLKHGADPNYRDRHGMTALYYMRDVSRGQHHQQGGQELREADVSERASGERVIL